MGQYRRIFGKAWHAADSHDSEVGPGESFKSRLVSQANERRARLAALSAQEQAGSEEDDRNSEVPEPNERPEGDEEENEQHGN